MKTPDHCAHVAAYYFSESEFMSASQLDSVIGRGRETLLNYMKIARKQTVKGLRFFRRAGGAS